MESRLQAFSFLAFLFSCLFFVSGCFEMRISQDPYYLSFFEKARLIMTDEEIEIYKSLADDASREEFIEEFWKIRDPEPGTEENEAKIEFRERIDYANLWFGTFNPRRGREVPQDERAQVGWNEDRGRIYIVLGPPDVIYFAGEGDESISYDASRDIVRAEQWTFEQWIYDRYSIYVIFQKSPGGTWILSSFDQALYEVMEFAKLNWVFADFKGDLKRRFKFKAQFEDSAVKVTVEVKRISFDENFRAEFDVKINVYHNRKKIDEIKLKKVLEESQEELEKVKNIEFAIPYKTDQKGPFLFDVVIQDMLAPAFAKYRSLVKHKF